MKKQISIIIFLFTLSILAWFYSKHHLAGDGSTRELIEKVDTALEQTVADITNFDGSAEQITALNNSVFDILILSNDKPIYWNEYKKLDAYALESRQNYVQLKRGLVEDKKYLIALDLQDHDRIDKQLHINHKYEIVEKGDVALTNFEGKPVFIEEIVDARDGWPMYWSLALLLLAISFFSYSLVKWANTKKLSTTICLVLLAVAFLLLNFTNLLSTFYELLPFQYVAERLMINKSVGHILLNCTLAFAAVSLFKKKIRLNSRPSLYVGAVLIPFLAAVSFSYLCLLAKAIIETNTVLQQAHEVFQFTKAGFSYLLTFIFLSLFSFYFCSVLFKVLKERELQISPTMKYLGWVVGIALTWPLHLFWQLEISYWVLACFVLSFFLMLDIFLELKEKKIIYIFWWLLIYSGFISAITFQYQLKANAKFRLESSKALYTQIGENDEQMAIQVDQLLKSSELFPSISKLPANEKLYKFDLLSYVKQILNGQVAQMKDYELNLEVNDESNATLFYNYFISENFDQKIALSTAINEHAFFNPYTNQFIFIYAIENEAFTPKQIQLFVTLTKRQSLPIADADYLVIKKGKVAIKNIKSDITASLADLLNLEDQIKIKDDISFTAYAPVEDVKIITLQKIGGLIKPISLFSFTAALASLLLFILTLFNTIYRFLPSDIDLKFYDKSSLRTRIQITIILLIIFSFLIIGIVTTFYFNNLLEKNKSETFNEDVVVLQNSFLNEVQGVATSESALFVAQNKLKEIADIQNSEFALFDEAGSKISETTKTPLERIPFVIYQKMTDGNYNALSQDGYSFIPLRYNNRSPYATVALSDNKYNLTTRDSILDFLSTILNVYIFLFLIAGALAIAIGNSITRPLSILNQKLKEYKLGKQTDPLEWETKDEIGILINDYNQLTKELEQSANVLAQTERDLAWREMAKQVAHEIKNPLTPMKLSIQYLKKAIEQQPERSIKLIGRVSETLIEQINNLNQIANEFSSFATMPKAENQKVVLNEIVESIHDLFRKRDDIDIKLSEPIDDLTVFADRNHLVRILNNIVKNAIQAIPQEKRGLIKIELFKRNNNAVVQITDNGTGIPDHMKNKVFTPNFTTKSSGTGLGLAISANMIESFNGKIYFETEVNVGTSFFVEIPLMRKSATPRGSNRVSLD